MNAPQEAITPGILRRLLRQQVYVAFLVGSILWLLYQVRDVFPLFLFAFILAYLLGPLVRRVSGPEGQGVSRGTAALIVYLMVIVLLGFLIYLGYNVLHNEILAYGKDYPKYQESVADNLRVQESAGFLKALPQSGKDAINNVVDNSSALLSSLVAKTLPGLVHSAPKIIELIAVPIVAYYLLTDYKRFIAFVRRVVRPEGRDRFDDLLHEINSSLRGYLAGQLTLSLIAGVAATVILALNGVRPALVVGIAAVILELVPVIGPLAWALAAIGLTYIQRPSHTIIVAVLVLVAHQVDMHILAPRILGKHLRLHPAVVIFALLAGNALMGILGILLAAPLAATLNISLTYLIKDGALSPSAVAQGDDIPLPPAAPGPPVQAEHDTPPEQATSAAPAEDAPKT